MTRLRGALAGHELFISLTVRPGAHGNRTFRIPWHRRHSINAPSTPADEAASPLCTGCAFGGIRQTNTNHLRKQRALPTCPGQQFALDAYGNSRRSYRIYNHFDSLTDLASRHGSILPTSHCYPNLRHPLSDNKIGHLGTVFACR